MKKQTLTVAELKSLIFARFSAEQRKLDKLGTRIRQQLGIEIQGEKPEDAVIDNKLMDWLSDLFAHRLKQNMCTTPLLSSQDYVPFVSLLIEIYGGDELDGRERKRLEKFAKTMFENIVKKARAMMPSDKNLYEEYWRWVTTVLDLAAERGISPTELLALENATDEIMRRMFTKKEFIAFSKRWAANDLMDLADMFKKMLLQTYSSKANPCEKSLLFHNSKSKNLPTKSENFSINLICMGVALHI